MYTETAVCDHLFKSIVQTSICYTEWTVDTPIVFELFNLDSEIDKYIFKVCYTPRAEQKVNITRLLDLEKSVACRKDFTECYDLMFERVKERINSIVNSIDQRFSCKDLYSLWSFELFGYSNFDLKDIYINKIKTNIEEPFVECSFSIIETREDTVVNIELFVEGNVYFLFKLTDYKVHQLGKKQHPQSIEMISKYLDSMIKSKDKPTFISSIRDSIKLFLKSY